LINLHGPADRPGRWWLLVRRNRRSGELAFYRCFSPRSVPLSELVRVAGRRWTVEETFQAGKGLAGLDEHQVRRWTSWHRWATLAMLAHAFLAVAAATERRDHPAPDDLAPLTCNEIQHLYTTLIARPPTTRSTGSAGRSGDADTKPGPAIATTDGRRPRSCDWVLQFAGRVAPGSRDQCSLPARLAEAQHVAGGIAEGAVADAVWLVDRLLQHLATRGADALEGGVAVVGPEDDTAQQALRQQFRRGLLVGGRGVRVRDGRLEKMSTSGCDGAPTVTQRIPSNPTSLRTSTPKTSR
jgi:hypothetical protein